MSMGPLTRNELRKIQARVATFPVTLTELPVSQWPPSAMEMQHPPIQVWRSQSFLVQLYREHEHNFLRLTISRTLVSMSGEYGDEISWDRLQQIKRDVGYGEWCAVEVFPPDSKLVNVANMRHLWLYPRGEFPPFMWGQRSEKGTTP